jgi:hypothetical protein
MLVPKIRADMACIFKCATGTEFRRVRFLSGSRWMMTNEGRERAKARGVRFGRKLKLTAHQRREALARREVGEALTDIARTFGVSHSTISKLAGVTFMQ